MVLHRGDVVLVPFPFADRLARKTRPAVVLSSDEFGAVTGWCVVAMVTSQQQTTPFDTPILDWEYSRLLHPSWARAKLASIDMQAVRLVLGPLSGRDMAGLTNAVQRALGLG